jgi:hypothetical protein
MFPTPMGTNGSRRAGPGPENQGLRALMRTLAVLALAIQCLVIQTHVDIPGMRAQAAAETAQGATASSSERGQSQHRRGGDCTICQAAAMGRVGLVTPTMVLRLEEPVGIPVALSAIAARAPRATSHAWRSRAPPLQL